MERATKPTVAAMLAVLALAVPASAAPLAGFVLVGQTEHLSFYSRDGKRFDGEKSERYLRRLQGLFGASLAGRSDYYRCDRPEDVASATGLYASGVTSARERRVFSTRDFHAHELVHLVAGQLGTAGSFFDEGLAVALSDEAGFRKADVDRAARRLAEGARVSDIAARFGQLEPENAYALAGSFVGFLLETHGIERVADFLRQCGAAGAQRDAAFERVFGQTLDQAGAAWRLATSRKGGSRA